MSNDFHRGWMGSYEIFTNAVILLQGKITMHETLPVEFREANATLFASKPDDVMKKIILSEL